MMKKLRIRFVVLSMILLVLMQVFILGITTWRSYSNIIQRADKTIEQIQNGTGENIEARYFTVSTGTGEKNPQIGIWHTMQLDRETAKNYAREVLERKKEDGIHNGYRYRIFTQEDGDKTVIFIDRASYLEVIKNNALSGILFSSIAIVIMFFILLFFSRRVVRPFEIANRKQKEFITSASHELKTPLAVMSADAQLLENEVSENEWLKDLENQIDKMNRMTNELTELSKMDEGADDLRVLFPLSDFADEVVESYKSVALNRNIRFEKSIAPGIAYTGNQNDILRLLEILLDNAFKYCPENGLIKVTLSKNSKVLFAVSNTVSESYTEEELGKFFDRFYRRNTEKEKGFGIGLSVAKAITEKHKGNIEAVMQDEKTLSIRAMLH